MAEGLGVLGTSKREQNVAAALRRLGVAKLKTMSVDAATEALGLLPRGVEVMLWKSEWSLETAFRVCMALELDVVERIEQACVESPLNTAIGKEGVSDV